MFVNLQFYDRQRYLLDIVKGETEPFCCFVNFVQNSTSIRRPKVYSLTFITNSLLCTMDVLPMWY